VAALNQYERSRSMDAHHLRYVLLAPNSIDLTAKRMGELSREGAEHREEVMSKNQRIQNNSQRIRIKIMAHDLTYVRFCKSILMKILCV
jgi:hypothetical protein